MFEALLHAAVTGTAGTLAVAGLLTAFGTRRAPPPLAAVNGAFNNADWSALGPLPELQHLTARDGTLLAWRSWPCAAPQRTAILVHGSTADSRSLHALATRLSQGGTRCHALDMRGHGDSGRRGDIDYIGQLEDDIADLVQHLRQSNQITGDCQLLGHSSGGGFALRLAGGPHGELFDAYVLAAPMIHHAPPLSRPRVGGWAVPFIPRIVGLTILRRLGLRWWEHLPVIAFATPAGDPSRTSTYSFRLQSNFRPHMNWRADARGVRRPMSILIGAHDELFDGQAYPQAFQGLNEQIRIQVLPDMPHSQWYVTPKAIDALHQALVHR